MGWSDEQLASYLAGDLSPETARVLEKDLTQDDALSRRLAALDPIAEQVRAAFQSVPVAERVAALPPLPQHAAPGFGRIAGYALAACLGAAAMFGGLSWTKPQASWVEAVAAYQVLYGPETIAPIAVTPQALSAQFARASQALGVTLDARVISEAAPDLDLRRAQVLNLDGETLIQIVFAGQNGEPIALCLMQGRGGSGWRYREIQGLEGAYTDTGRLRLLVIGPTTADNIQRWSRTWSAVL